MRVIHARLQSRASRRVGHRGGEFYIDRLGLPLLEERPGSFGFRLGELRCSVIPGGVTVADDVETPAPVTLMLRTDDLEASIAELAGRGVIFIGPISEAPGFMRHAPFIDQDNNMLWLCQYLRDPLAATVSNDSAT